MSMKRLANVWTGCCRRSERKWNAVQAQAGIPAGGHAVQTWTRVDTGGWGLNPRLRAAVRGRELVLFAPGKRPFVESVPFAALGESRYNHVTGELVLAPAPEAQVRRLKVPPVEGRELLEEIQGKEH
jgi:hypothetical protein